jgi:FkbM family methyltransferase
LKTSRWRHVTTFGKQTQYNMIAISLFLHYCICNAFNNLERNSTSRIDAASVSAFACPAPLDQIFTRDLGENGVLLEVLKSFPSGACNRRFVEMGANDGVNSNTFGLERSLGWRGACVEPGTLNYRALVRNRPLCRNINAAISAHSKPMVFREFSAGALYGHSGFVSARTDAQWWQLLQSHPECNYTDTEITTLSTAALLDRLDYTEIDLFSLDVEGFEMEILREFPFDRVRVRVWVVETNKLSRQKFVSLMLHHRYRCRHFDRVNTICSMTYDAIAVQRN